MNKLKALCQLIIKNTWDNKVVFLYTLIFPGCFFIYMNLDLLKTQVTMTILDLSMVFAPYWSYIIVVNILNNVALETLAYRENGFYKVMTYVVGNKYLLYFSILLVQFLLTLFQLISFTFVFMLLMKSFYSRLLIACMVLLLVTYLPVNLFVFQLVNYKLKKDTVGMFGTMALFLMFFFLKFDSKNLFWSVLIYLNPLKYVNSVAAYLVNWLEPIYHVNSLSLLVSTGIFIVIGVISLTHFSINPYENRI